MEWIAGNHERVQQWNLNPEAKTKLILKGVVN